MKINAIARSVNWMMGVLTVAVILFFAIPIYDPLLFLTERDQWYVSKAIDLNMGSDTAVQFLKAAVNVNRQNKDARLLFVMTTAYNDSSKQQELYTIAQANLSWQSPQALYTLSEIKMKQCKFEEAKPLVIEGREKFPTYLKFYQNEAIILAKEKRFEDAQMIIKKGLEQEPATLPFHRYELQRFKLEALSLAISTNSTLPMNGMKVRELDMYWAYQSIHQCDE